MKTCLTNKKVAALFVNEQLDHLKPGSVLTMTISPDTLGGYCVVTATDASSEDIVNLLGRFYYDQLTNIY